MLKIFVVYWYIYMIFWYVKIILIYFITIFIIYHKYKQIIKLLSIISKLIWYITGVLGGYHVMVYRKKNFNLNLNLTGIDYEPAMNCLKPIEVLYHDFKLKLGTILLCTSWCSWYEDQFEIDLKWSVARGVSSVSGLIFH